MKVEIVSPPFPPDTPQVILENQSRLMNGAKFVPAILRKVARKYRNLLLQNVLFNGKLLDLTVMIHPIDGGHDNRTSGEYYGEDQRGRLHAIIDANQAEKMLRYLQSGLNQLSGREFDQSVRLLEQLMK